MPLLRPRRNLLPGPHRSSLDSNSQHGSPHNLPLHCRRSHQSIWLLNKHIWNLRHRSSNLPLPRFLQFRLDAPPVPLPTRSPKLPHPCQRHGHLHLLPQWRRTSLRLFFPVRSRSCGLENIYDEWKLGCT